MEIIILIGIIVALIIYGISKPSKKPTDKGLDIAPPKDSKESLFIQTWSLLDFAKQYGPKMQVGIIHTKEGRPFRKIQFVDKNGKCTPACFFSQLRELTSSEISARKNELKISKMSNGKYYLHNNNIREWEDIDLGL